MSLKWNLGPHVTFEADRNLRDVLVSSTPPTRPLVFHGREEFIEKSVDALVATSSANIAIMGGGGMGKTAAALVILHHERIAETFGRHRYFVSCETASNAETVLGHLALVLSLQHSTDPLSSIVDHLSTGPRTLLVLDNLETAWLVEEHTQRTRVEKLLACLAALPTINLITTCRGNTLPPEVLWANPGNASLPRISLHAARRTFVDIAGCPPLAEEEAVLDSLLEEFDCMPLAVTLAARLGQRGLLPSALFARWERSRTRLLQTHKSGRSENLDACLGISIDLLRNASRNEEPLKLLTICSDGSNGLKADLFEGLRGEFEDIDAARDLLETHALLEVGRDGELVVRSPLRHYIRRYHPVIKG